LALAIYLFPYFTPTSHYLKGVAMIRILLFCAMLFQAGSPMATKPLIENERVTVSDLADSATAQPLDAVVVSLSGTASFLPKGATPKFSGKSIVIDLKDHQATPYKNTTTYPLAFPRPGSKKILENDRVIVWDYTWTPNVATPMHFHDKDVVVMFLEDGDLKSTTADGQATVNPYKPGTVRYNLGGRTHTETLIRGEQRAIITELK
jgi:hypothetical protein